MCHMSPPFLLKEFKVVSRTRGLELWNLHLSHSSCNLVISERRGQSPQARTHTQYACVWGGGAAWDTETEPAVAERLPSLRECLPVLLLSSRFSVASLSLSPLSRRTFLTFGSSGGIKQGRKAGRSVALPDPPYQSTSRAVRNQWSWWRRKVAWIRFWVGTRAYTGGENQASVWEIVFSGLWNRILRF